MLIDSWLTWPNLTGCPTWMGRHSRPWLENSVERQAVGFRVTEVMVGGVGEQSYIYKERATAFFSISILPKIGWAMWSMSVLVNFKLGFPFFIGALKQWTDKCDLLSGTRSFVMEVPQAKIICLKAAGAFWVVGHILKREYNCKQFKSNAADWRKRLAVPLPV